MVSYPIVSYAYLVSYIYLYSLLNLPSLLCLYLVFGLPSLCLILYANLHGLLCLPVVSYAIYGLLCLPSYSLLSLSVVSYAYLAS